MSATLYGSATFRSDPTPKILVDTSCVIQAVNPAYLRASQRSSGELLSMVVFDVFPDNPDDPTADGVERLGASFERVLRTRSSHNMVIQHYDIADPASGQWLERYWVPVNAPVWDGDEVVGIEQQVTDVTRLRADVRAAMEQYRELLAVAVPASAQAEEHQQLAHLFTQTAAVFNELVDEVTNLRRALETRGVIEQAKGMLMATRHCDAGQAFDILRQMSQDTNVRLVDVAGALVYQFESHNSDN